MKVSPDTLAAFLSPPCLWLRKQETLTRSVTFPSFPRAIEFVNAVAQMAEAHNHHPDIDIRHRVVTLALTTHDENGLTEKDIALAEAIDSWLGD
jgi:4a-hydroxytetrahydrobiopterin dehydratase